MLVRRRRDARRDGRANPAQIRRLFTARSNRKSSQNSGLMPPRTRVRLRKVANNPAAARMITAPLSSNVRQLRMGQP